MFQELVDNITNVSVFTERAAPSNCSAQMPPPCHVQIVCPPMNYDKATIFYVLVPYIRRVGNRPEKLAISTLLELW